MVYHELANLKELHNPLKGKLSKVAEYFIGFYGEQYREKIMDIFKNVEFVFVDPVNTEGRTSFQIYFDEIRKNIFANLNLKLSTKGIKIIDQEAFLENINGVEKPGWKIEAKDYNQVINLLCAFDVHYLPENLQLLADKTVSINDFEMLIKEKDVKKDLLKFFSTLNAIYKERAKQDFEQLDADQKRLGFDKSVDYKSENNNFDIKMMQLICDTVADQFSIPKTKGNYAIIFGYLPDYLPFFKGGEAENIRGEQANLEKMFDTFYQLSSNKEAHKQLKAQLDEGKLDLSSPYFKNLQSYYTKFTEEMMKIIREKDETVLSMFDDTKDAIKTIKEKNLAFDDQVLETLNAYKFKRLDINSYVDSSGSCIYTIDKDKPHTSKNFIVLNSYLLLQDRTLFHELNHALQIRTVKDGEDAVIMKIGVPSARISFSNDDVKLEHTLNEKATMFNEVLNDYLTEKIFEPARGVVRIGREVESEEGFYLLAFPFLKKFFDKNLDILKECAISDDPYSYVKSFDKNDLTTLIVMTDELMQEIKRDTNSYDEFVKQKFLLDLVNGRNTPPSELNEQYFDEECRKYVRYLKKFSKLADEIKPLSHQDDSEKNADDENDSGRDE